MALTEFLLRFTQQTSDRRLLESEALVDRPVASLEEARQLVSFPLAWPALPQGYEIKSFTHTGSLGDRPTRRYGWLQASFLDGVKFDGSRKWIGIIVGFGGLARRALREIPEGAQRGVEVIPGLSGTIIDGRWIVAEVVSGSRAPGQRIADVAGHEFVRDGVLALYCERQLVTSPALANGAKWPLSLEIITNAESEATLLDIARSLPLREAIAS